MAAPPITTTTTPAVTGLAAGGAKGNLLPGVGHVKDVTLSPGIYIGEGLLADKIIRWEFVEMAELLPEFWSSMASKDPTPLSALRQGASTRKQAVTDIATWIQCFANYISVMSAPHPVAVPELLAYLIFILRASQEFGGVAWVCSLSTSSVHHRKQAVVQGQPVDVFDLFCWSSLHRGPLRALPEPLAPDKGMHPSG